MSDIPFELHREILLRLPAEPLFRFRTVCKSWRRIIDDPSFLRSFTTNNQLPSPNLLIRSRTGNLYSLSLDSPIHINADEQTIDATHVNYLVRQGVHRLPEFPVARCDGLIVIPDYHGKIFVIWNPLTDVFHEFPKLDIEVNLVGCGIGYDSASDDYKVVRIDEVSRVFRTIVYSLRLNSWKRIMDCPIYFFQSADEAVFLNGALHWRSEHTIIVLDLATEEYRELAMPPEPAFSCDTRLDALDGCLVLSVVGGPKRAWVMKDHGVEPKWIELFSSVERRMVGGSSSGWVWPIAYSKSERQLILQRDNEIIVWDIEKCSAKMVTIHGLLGSLSSQICPRSIFQFNGIVGGKKRKMYESSTRLKLLFTITTDIPCVSDSDGSSSEED